MKMTEQELAQKIARGRTRKAHAIAKVLAGLGIAAKRAAEFTVAQRKLAAAVAEVREPSDDTWALVVEMLEDSNPLSTRTS